MAQSKTDETARFDAIVIGAGISGMYFVYRLREMGMTVRVFEAGSGVGGTWYWNRYPGHASTQKVIPSTPRRKSFVGYPRGGSPSVIPAQAGIQWVAGRWIPACAGMTASGTGKKLLPGSTSGRGPDFSCKV